MSPQSPPDRPSHASDPASWLRTVHLWQIQPVRDVILVAGIVALAWLGYALSAVTVPLLLGLLIAYLFEPLVAWLSRFRWCPRPVAALGIVVVVYGAILVGLVIAVPLIVGQAVSLVERARSGVFEARAMELIEKLPAQYQDDARRGARWIFGSHDRDADHDHDASLADARSGEGQEESHEEAAEETRQEKGEQASPSSTSEAGTPESGTPESGTPEPGATETTSPTSTTTLASGGLQSAPPAGADAEPAAPRPVVVESVRLPGASGSQWSILDVAGSGLRTAWSAIVSILTLSLAIVLIPFYFYYFSISYPRTVEFLGGLVPETHRPKVFDLARKMDRAVAGFVRGRIVISAIMGAMLAVGWLIVGVPYAILLGLITGVFCLVPYLGGVGLPIAIGLLFLEEAGVPEASRMGWISILVWPTVVFLIVQAVEGYVLTPVIAGRATDLSILSIFVAVLAGGALAGVYGMLLAIPVAACVKIILVEVVEPRIRAWTRGEASDPLPVD